MMITEQTIFRVNSPGAVSEAINILVEILALALRSTNILTLSSRCRHHDHLSSLDEHGNIDDGSAI